MWQSRAISPWRGRQGLYWQADEFSSSPVLSTASPRRSARSALWGGCIHTQGALLKMDCATQREGKLKLVTVHIEEAGSWGRAGVCLFLLCAWVDLCESVFLCARVVRRVSTQSRDLYIDVHFPIMTTLIDPVQIQRPWLVCCTVPTLKELLHEVNPKSFIKLNSSLNKFIMFRLTWIYL